MLWACALFVLLIVFKDYGLAAAITSLWDTKK